MDKNKESFTGGEIPEKIVHEDSRTFSGNEIMSPEFNPYDDSPLEEDIIEEEVMFTNELNEIENEEHLISSEKAVENTFEFEKDYFRMGDRYGRVLFLREYASYIKDDMIAELTDMNRNLMLSIDVIPVPTDEAVQEVEKRLLYSKELLI